MSYPTHILAVIDAMQDLTGLSDLQLCARAGLSKNWLGTFRRTGRATVASADAVLRLARQVCPESAEGDHLRALIAALDPAAARDGTTDLGAA